MLPLKSNLCIACTYKKGLLFLWAILFGLTSSLFSQTAERDSLRAIIKRIDIKSNPKSLDTTYISTLNLLAKDLRYYNNDSLLILSKKALLFSNDLNYDVGKCQSLINIGAYYSDIGNHKTAIKNYGSALTIANKIKNFKLVLRIQNNIASEHTYMGDYSKALNVYLIGIELAKLHDEKTMLSIMNENVANLYVSQRDYEQALVFYNKVKAINKEIGDEIITAETLSNIASLYADMSQLDLAMFNINKSIAVFEKHSILDWLAYAYNIKGKIYFQEKEYKWALYWYKQSEMLHGKIDDERGKIEVLNGLAKTNLALKKDSLSEIYANEAYTIASQIQSKEGILNSAETLYKVYKNEGNYDKALTYLEISQKLADTIFRSENNKGLAMLRTKLKHEKQKELLMEENERELAKQKSYVTISLIIVLVFIIVTFIILRNQKVQKRLYVELQEKQLILEKQKIELNEINSTKDKLFSIIGHDLRGPIGALEGLLKLFRSGDIEKSELKTFMSKLNDDVSNVSFTLNNLLTWGQSQMNGTVTQFSAVTVESLVSDNVALLSEAAEKKSIKIINRIQENTLVWSDVNQIDIVIRNLISNALKFTPNDGMITIESEERKKDWLITVKDTGIGMSKQIQDKLFVKSTNFTTYGTNNEKGTGLGLSLCKEMVENNNGEIWVESAPNRGTCFFFTLPKGQNKYQKVS